MLDSKPEASSAVTVVSAGASVREGRAGAGILWGACLWDCDEAGGLPCAAACQATAAPSPKSAVSRPTFLISGCRSPHSGKSLSLFAPLAFLGMEGDTG